MRRLRGKGVKIIEPIEGKEEEKGRGGNGRANERGKGKETIEGGSQKAGDEAEQEEFWGYSMANPPTKMFFPSEEAKLGKKRVRPGVVGDEEHIDPAYLEFLKFLDRKFYAAQSLKGVKFVDCCCVVVSLHNNIAAMFCVVSLSDGVAMSWMS